MYLPEALALQMRKQHYHLVGSHSAVKACKWLRESITGRRTCYKNTFYGINSWQCVQCSPMVSCNLACRFCWRISPDDIGVKWNEMREPKWDSPEMLADGFLMEQRRIVSGYKGNPKVVMERWREANSPAHVAISLIGEVTLYPYLSELIEIFHKKGMSTFVVTNGTFPKMIEKLNPLPTQLYMSLEAPDEETYAKTCRPRNKEAWKGVNETLELFPSLKTRKVLRLTLVNGLNMVNPEGYAKLIMKAQPDYVEPKSFVFVGGARYNRGLSLNDMPKHEEIREFARKLSEETGYIISDERKDSRVVLLCRDRNAEKSRFIQKK
ncbi:MAG: 4-demethylwyosine synthase TYW1 [Candidatus Micrarchaeia archaeon]